MAQVYDMWELLNNYNNKGATATRLNISFSPKEWRRIEKLFDWQSVAGCKAVLSFDEEGE